jgi:DNA modification methylase
MTNNLQNKKVEIQAAKGRPMLTWVGKRPLRHVTAFPAQLVEQHNAIGILGMNYNGNDHTDRRRKVFADLRTQWNDKCWDNDPCLMVPAPEHGGLLFHGDNKEVLAFLLANGYRGKVNFIYIDPPFDSGADYVRKVSLRGVQGTAKINGDGYTLGEQIQYTDIWANDNYLQFMYERLLLLKEILADDGSIAVHCDVRRSHYLRIILDEIFGADNIRGEIVVRAGVKNVQSQFDEMSSLTLGHNSIFLFSKGKDTKYQTLRKYDEEHEPGKWDTFWRGTDRPTMRYELLGQKPNSGQWRWEENRAKQAIENYRKYTTHFSKTMNLDDYYLQELDKGQDLNFVRLSEDNVVQYYVSPRKYKILSNVWLDIPYRGTETDYPTEKNEAISERIIEWLTRPGDLVLDSFIGSGTVASVAQKLGRRWIGCDINKGAIQTTTKRLRGIIFDQINKALKRTGQEKQGVLIETECKEDNFIKPAQFGFNVFRVNDYDLQIQHNEAVNLACEHIGITRNKADSFFDGTLGKKLVKIIPFNHPLTPLDLAEIKRELGTRLEEERDIVVVCLGKELAVETWLNEWNQLRKKGDVPNKIEVIELRTDPKYGKFISHQPVQAKINIKRIKNKIRVEIQDFISPTIIERLKQQAGILTPQIDDWRAMVDSIMIDPAYNGKIFNIALTDVPEKKSDLVSGTYDLDAPESETTVAVKITDMLGEEVLIVKNI